MKDFELVNPEAANDGVITVEQLYNELGKLIKKGKGGKKILLSQDDEGNGYHQMFYGVTTNLRDVFGGVYAPHIPYGISKATVIKDYVIIG